jgi:transposase
MATERLAMHQLREILRQKLVQRRSHREVASAVGVSVGLVSGVMSRVAALGLSAEQIDVLEDTALEEKLYGPRVTHRTSRPRPDPAEMHLELRRAGVTLQVLHLEYLEKYPDGYRYTSYCDVYREWLAKRSPTMRQTHIAGDKMFVDYSGKRPRLVHRATGEVTDVELYVAVLGASNYTYVEATFTQQVPDFVASTARALAFYGGVPRAIVPDQLKSAVTLASRYDPGIQRTFADFGRHYRTTILPARPASPRDKAKVEVGVQIAQRWILARIRNDVFHELGELNLRIRELTTELNARTMRLYKASRVELFERLERPILAALPADAFEHGAWKKVMLNVDYHVAFDDHFYSAPHALIQEELWVRATTTSVEIFHHGTRVASHVRSHEKFKHTTVMAHMPTAHQKHAEWTPTRILGWARTVGPMTENLVQAILTERRHPEHGYRSCLGLFRLAKRYGNERTEAACARALTVSARSYRHVESILKHGFDRAPALDTESSATNDHVVHENVRGRDYYH